MTFCKIGDSYILDLHSLVDILPSVSIKYAVLQLPDGLKPYSVEVLRCIREKTGLDIVIHGDSTYGSCDLQIGKLSILGDILVLHAGHTPYPPNLYSPPLEALASKVRVVYLPIYSTLRLSPRLVDTLVRELVKANVKRVALLSTLQHLHLLESLKDTLDSQGLKAIIPRGDPPYLRDGQVIGCDYRVARRAGDVDGYVIVSGGAFHSLGLYLATRGRVFQIDPYESRVRDVSKDGERVLRHRLFLIAKAMELRRAAVIVGLKEGQHRPWLVSRLLEAMSSADIEYYVIVAENITKESLGNLDSRDIEYYVVTSCPRLAIDDLSDFHKPVLTPGETFMAIEGKLEPYRFPW